MSHDPEMWNFSDNTDLSEVLVIAKKLDEKEAKTAKGSVVYANLWQRPRTAVEALHIAQTLADSDPPDVTKGQGALEVSRGTTKVAEVLSVPWVSIRDSSWMPPAAFAQNELVRSALHLVDGEVYIPGRAAVNTISVTRLGVLGKIGPDRRDIHDGFSVTDTRTPYAALWGHDAEEATTLSREPNKYLSPLAKAKAGRPLRKVTDLWPRSGRIVLGERLRLNTQRVVAVRMTEKVLGNVWWPFALKKDGEPVEKALVLWMNSTLGLIGLLAHREETEGAWVAFKKPVLGDLLVLDPTNLTGGVLDKLAAAFDAVASKDLQPFPSMATDPVRAEIDAAICAALGLPDVKPIRDLLAVELVVSTRRLS